MLGRSDLGEVEIVCQDETVIGFCEFHQTVVDWGVIQLVIQDGSVEKNHTFKLAYSVETGTSAKTLLGIFAVGKKLELIGDAARNDNVIADEAGFGDFDETGVHEGGGINVNFAFLISGDEGMLTAF